MSEVQGFLVTFRIDWQKVTKQLIGLGYHPNQNSLKNRGTYIIP